uniref:Uncharacterized protein n=1 Tax=Buteo japonicus TaxID=224669 RepID=A0A8C0AVK6_9AVES
MILPVHCSVRTFRSTHRILNCFLGISKVVLQNLCFPLQEKNIIIIPYFLFKIKLASILSSTLRICRKSPSTLQSAMWMHLGSRMEHRLSRLGTCIPPWISWPKCFLES